MPDTTSACALIAHTIDNKAKTLLHVGLLLNLLMVASACSTSDTPTSISSTKASSVGDASQAPASESESEPAGSVLPQIVVGDINGEDNTSDTGNGQPISEALCSAESSVMQQRTLQLINEARAEARSCGNENYLAAQPLRWNGILAIAATGHSRDMATNNFFAHTGSNGSSASMRITNAGYNWWRVGENIAAGRTNAAQTINDWLESPGHCRNIMNPNFTEVAVSCIENNNTDFRRYWTNILAAPM